MLGASGQVGRSVVSLLSSPGARVRAFARDSDRETLDDRAGIAWFGYDTGEVPAVAALISCIPLWELPRYFPLIEQSGAKRVVVLSSTSRFSKGDSADPEERQLARRLETGEDTLKNWARARGVDWVILRPTMIYGRGRDHNVSSLLRFLDKFGFLVVLGPGEGLRQPVYVDDVARAAVTAVEAGVAGNRAYNLSGGETLNYLELCRRLFAATGRPVRILRIPRPLYTLVRPLGRLLPQRYRGLLPMLERMNRDLVFDHGEAARDLGFAPRPFVLTREDLQFESNRIIP